MGAISSRMMGIGRYMMMVSQDTQVVGKEVIGGLFVLSLAVGKRVTFLLGGIGMYFPVTLISTREPDISVLHVPLGHPTDQQSQSSSIKKR